LGCEGLGTKLFDEALVIYFPFDFPRSNYHFIVVFFSVRRLCSPSF
jgi:hypothetical protein